MAQATIVGRALVPLVIVGLFFASPHPLAQEQEPPGQPGLPAPGLRQLDNGLHAITVQEFVEHGEYARTEDPPCNAQVNERLRSVGAAAVAAADWTKLAKVIALPLVLRAADEADRFLRTQGGDIAAWLAPFARANCIPIGAVIPQGATITEIEYLVGDGERGVHRCNLDDNQWMVCDPPGYARWDNLPKIGVSATGVVAAVFKNWSHDRARWASMTISFREPAPRKRKPSRY